MNITITGGVGNLAEYVAQDLLARGHQVLLTDRLEPGQGRFQWKPDLPYLKGDLTHFEDCQKMVAQADAVIHLGGIIYATDEPGVEERQRAAGRPVLPFDETMRVNTMGTWYLLEASRRAKVKTVVMASTNVVLGFAYLAQHPEAIQYFPIDEEHPLFPAYSYDLSKRFDEMMMDAFTRMYGLRTYALRPAAIHRLERLQGLAERGQPGEKGQPTTEWARDFYGYVEISDMARAFRMCLEAAEEMPPHAVFYINAADTRVREDSLDLVRKFQPHLLAKPIRLEGRQSFISTAKAKKYFDWEPQHSWTELLK